MPANKKKTDLFSILVFVLVGLFLLLPLLMTFLYSLVIDFTGLIPKGFTIKHYVELITGSQSILSVLGRTLLIAVVPTLITLVIVLLALFATMVYYPKMDAVLSLITKIPYGIQGIILAVSLIGIYANSNTFFSNRILLLIFAYCVVISPYMYQGVKNALMTIEMMPILEAAEVLGSNKLATYFTIVVPGIGKGILATSLLCAGILFGDFVLVNILAGNYYETLGIFLNKVRSKSGATAGAISSLMFVIMLLFSATVTWLNREKKSIKTDEKEEDSHVVHRI